MERMRSVRKSLSLLVTSGILPIVSSGNWQSGLVFICVTVGETFLSVENIVSDIITGIYFIIGMNGLVYYFEYVGQ